MSNINISNAPRLTLEFNIDRPTHSLGLRVTVHEAQQRLPDGHVRNLWVVERLRTRTANGQTKQIGNPRQTTVNSAQEANSLVAWIERERAREGHTLVTKRGNLWGFNQTQAAVEAADARRSAFRRASAAISTVALAL